MDEKYEKAIRRRQELRRELDEVEAFIRLYEKLFLARQGSGTASPPPEAGRRRPERNVFPPQKLAELAREEILARGHPMTRGELAEALELRGIPLAGKDPSKNLGTILWRFQDRFLNIPGRGYWPKDLPLEEIDYVPGRLSNDEMDSGDAS